MSAVTCFADWKNLMLEHIEQMQAGYVVVTCDAAVHELGMCFGTSHVPFLKDPKTGRVFDDDPMVPARNLIPFAEWEKYMQDWYWTRHRAINEGKYA